MSLRLSKEAAEVIRQHARNSRPNEGCGALIGSSAAILGAIPLQNSSPVPQEAFNIDAQQYLAGEQEASDQGLELVGFFHSHPFGDSRPSQIDIAQAMPGFVYVVVGADDSLVAWRKTLGAGMGAPVLELEKVALTSP